MKKNVIITGAYGAIGKAISKGIASNHTYKVWMIGQDESKLQNAVQEITKITGNQEVYGYAIDLSRKREIESFVNQWIEPLHVLINNAGTTPPLRTETPEGIEKQWAVNVLSYFWMMHYLKNKMDGAQDARIVNVASYYAGNLNLDDPEFKKRNYNNDRAYRQSKQANRMLTFYFAEKLRASGISVNSCHPGDVNSKLSNNLGFGGHESPDQGDKTPVWLATAPEIKGITGKYFSNQKETFDEYKSMKQESELLYELCLKYTY